MPPRSQATRCGDPQRQRAECARSDPRTSRAQWTDQTGDELTSLQCRDAVNHGPDLSREVQAVDRGVAIDLA